MLPALAQQPLEEVVVTARKRAENLQDTPISVSVFSSADLAHRSITNLADVTAHTPNLRHSGGPQGGSAGHYFIRGIGQVDFISSTDPGVGTYLDGVYFGRTTGAAFELLEVERIEVLRGPQGTLFGRNTIGGAINVVSATPPAEPTRSVALTVGQRNRREGRVNIGGPLVEDTLLADFALLSRSQDGWQRRLIDGGRFGDEDTYAARAALSWRPSDALNVVASFDATRGRGTADPHLVIAADAAQGGHPEFVLSDTRTTWSGQRSPDDLDVRGTSVTMTYALENITLKSISAYRSLRSDTGIDFDGSPFADLDQLVLTRQDQVSQELQVSGSALGDRTTWLAGLYYFREHIDQAIPLQFYGTLISQNNALENQSYAAFSHATHALTERLSISGGVRLTYESKQHAFDHFIDLGAVQNPLFPPTTLRDHWHAFTPKLGLEFRARDNLLLYVSASQGFRSGGFNGRPLGTAEFLSYEPENLTAYELGVKSEWLERRVRFNAAAFYSRYKDIQLTLTGASATGLPIVVTGNAGRAEVRGVELELTASLTERLLFGLNLGNLGTEYTELDAGAAVPRSARLPVAPRWTVNTSFDYAMPFGKSSRLRSRLDYSYTSRYNFLFDNPPLSWQSGYGLWNARLTFEPNSGTWDIATYVLNATNRRHSLFREDILSSAGTAIDWPARPREWGLDLTFRF